MNATIHNADGAVHIRIVTLALIAAIAITGFAISVRLRASDGMQSNIHASRTLKAQVAVHRSGFSLHSSSLNLGQTLKPPSIVIF